MTATATIITTNRERLYIADRYTTCCLTVRLKDGSYAFADGLGGYWRTALVVIPGYDYVYGRATASQDHDNAHDAARATGASFPVGSEIQFRDRV